MVKTFSPEMEICRQRQGHDVVWLVELDWDDKTGRYSSRAVTIGGTAYQPTVTEVRGLRLVLPPVVPGRETASGAVEVELVNTTEEGAKRFEIDAEDQLVEGRTVRVGFVFLDPTVVLDSADVVWLQTYQVQAVTLATTKAVLRLRESPSLAGHRLIGRRLLPGFDPQLSAAGVGRMIPLVFGRIEQSPLIPFRVGHRSYLRQALQVVDTVIAVEDASVYPESGLVQIGDEVIAYTAVDSAGCSLGRSDSPVVRTAPAYHRRGAAVDSIPENGFEFLVADHACRSVGPIYSGEQLVDPSDYSVATETLDGREVQKVVFPTLPSHVHSEASVQSLRIDGREGDNVWLPGTGNAADEPLAAVDGSGQATAALVDSSRSPLEIEYTGDLSKGGSTHGAFSRCWLAVEYSASQRWATTNDIDVTVGRGASSSALSLARPPLDESLGTLPVHSHADTIRDELADTRELFVVADQETVLEFETTQKVSGWADCERAIDGNLSTWCENVAQGAGSEATPLRLRLLRDVLGGDTAVELQSVSFHARLATDEAGPVVGALDVSVAGKYVNSWTVQAGSTPQMFECAIAAGGLTVADLTAPETEFAVRSVNGDNLKVYGAWLSVSYRPRITGRERTVSQRRSGAVASAAALPMPLPTKSYRQVWDLTDFVQSEGGWAFFAAESGNSPFVRVSFGAAGDATTVRLSQIAFEIEYTPRAGVTVFDRFDAVVKGIEDGGELVENPADVIEWLVTNEAGQGWGSGSIDQTSFLAAQQWLDARGWRASRRIGVPILLSTLLEDLAQESGCRLYWETGKLRLLPVASILLSSDAVATLDEDGILSAPLQKHVAPIDRIANVIRIHYGGGYTLGGAERRTRGVQWIEVKDAGSSVLTWGERQREFRAHWHASSAPESVSQLAAVWLARTAVSERTVAIDLPLSQSHLERGDVVVVDHAASRLSSAEGEVVGLEVVDGRYVRATVALQVLPMYCWYGDAQTFIAHLPGHTEKVFVIEGKRVAALDRTGRLRLASQVSEQSLPGHAMASPIEHDIGEHRLYFGAGDAQSGYAAVFALDDTGKLLLSGAARENVDLSALTTNGCHEAKPTEFYFSCDMATVILRYDATADRLDLEGTIVEDAPL